MTKILRPLTGLEQVLSYEPETGLLRWKVHIYRIKKPGDVAGGLNNKGYMEVRYNGITYMAHRVCWYLYTGQELGDVHIDHKDGNRANNRIDNLRLCTPQQNAVNKLKREGTTSKYKGVSFCRRHNKWLAQIRILSRSHYLGYYTTELEAHKAYCVAAIAEHDEFANFGKNSPFTVQQLSRAA